MDNKLSLKGAIKLQKIDEKLCYNVARFARTQISPIASYLGGILA
jgi:hypothetical protein